MAQETLTPITSKCAGAASPWRPDLDRVERARAHGHAAWIHGSSARYALNVPCKAKEPRRAVQMFSRQTLDAVGSAFSGREALVFTSRTKLNYASAAAGPIR